MASLLRFPDVRSAADARTFAARAARTGDSRIRLHAAEGTLAMTCAPLAPRGLLDATPTVLAMRAVQVDPELVCDIVVDAAALTESDDARALALPDTAVSAAWAGISPPREGWTERAALDASTLATRAQWGIAGVAEGVPRDAGEDAVRIVRAQVWGETDPDLLDLPRGVAFAAFALGFIVGEERVVVRERAPWTRLSFARGHVLVRGPVRTGLTAVRRTGEA